MSSFTPVFETIRPWLDAKGFNPDRIKALNAALAELSPGIAATAAATAAIVPHFKTMARHLEQEEGRIGHAYQDHLGYWTIGVGRLIDKRKGGRLTDDEIDMLLANDIARKIKDVEKWPAWQAVRDDPVRATAFLGMAFQMGAKGLSQFKTSLRLIEERQWQAAATSLLKSLWARQTPDRAKRVTHMIRTGRMP